MSKSKQNFSKFYKLFMFLESYGDRSLMVEYKTVVQRNLDCVSYAAILWREFD